MYTGATRSLYLAFLMRKSTYERYPSLLAWERKEKAFWRYFNAIPG